MRCTSRDLLLVGFVLAATSAAAGESKPPFEHYVPAEKQLSAEWKASLVERGSAPTWRGEALEGVGMPCGGIAAGQVYLRGDGTLASWHIFNRHQNTGYGRECYGRPIWPSPVDQGFAVVVEADGKRQARRLSREGFEDIAFVGEYPIGRVSYQDKGFPVRVELEAFSPFIPLNAKDSALPATLFHITVANTSGKPVHARVLGWLENAVLIRSAKSVRAVRQTRRLDGEGRTVLVHSAAEAPPPKVTGKIRPTIVLADFEGTSYGEWTVTGKAFGTGPAPGTLPEQQEVSGFRGKGLVNTYLGKDGPTGTLTSPPFTVDRTYIQFLIGGGKFAGRTCINLLVGGQAVRTAVGRNKERLAWHFWHVEEFAGKEARIQIVDQASGPWGHINIDQIELTDKPQTAVTGPVDQLPDFGTMAFALARNAAPADETERVLGALGDVAKGLRAGAREEYPAAESRSAALLGRGVEIAPKGKHTATFVVAWYFPNRPHGREYATRFRDAAAVAGYALDHHDRLAANTRLWHDTFYEDSTLPRWLLFRLHATVSNLATETAQWWANGRFWAWEGVGCCAGTCTHVWNYAQAHARLFPSLARSAREMQDFGAGFHANGLVGFRSNNAYAADGQAGTLLKAYREHLMSANTDFLRRNWPHIKQALRFCIEQDGDGDGLIEGSQHNTFDINFVGPNTFVGSLYLAALRAGEAMATEMGEEGFAARCRRIYESGRRLTMETLWDGEYFIQLVDLEKHPKFQYGRGCLSDQLFGQNWAHQLGLGYLYPGEQVKTALRSVWRYNWAPDVGPHNRVHPPFRVFARPGEPGLFTCTWPKSEHLEGNAVRYKNEVWTGIEYQAAAHMIWEGMLTEGLSIIRGVHERYQPENHNPYNEVECGDHYARALASWGAYLGLAGMHYHGPKGHLAFAPRFRPEDFRAAFTTAEGWGTYAQERQGRKQASRIALKWGRLRLTRLALALPDAPAQPKATAPTLDGKTVPCQPDVEAGRLVLTFEEPLVIKQGQTLQAEVSW